VLIADGATTAGGFGAEVASRLQEQRSGSLARLLRRLGSGDARVPAAFSTAGRDPRRRDDRPRPWPGARLRLAVGCGRAGWLDAIAIPTFR
jgi:hypothetical protein